MALSPEEKEKVINMLDKLDRSQIQIIVSSIEAFGNWLSSVAYSIYCKVKEAMNSLWSSICDFFS